MRGASFRGLIAGCAAALTACSLFTSLDGFTSADAVVAPDADANASESGDAEPADAPGDRTDAPSADAGDDAPPNLHPQGSFEGSSCAPWDGFKGTVAISPIARTGVGSCRVCLTTTGTGTFTADDEGAPGPATVGATYLARAWVRSDPSNPPSPAVSIKIRTFVRTPSFTVLESSMSPLVSIDSTWKSIETQLAVTKAATLNLLVGSEDVVGPVCFLVDDVTVQRIR